MEEREHGRDGENHDKIRGLSAKYTKEDEKELNTEGTEGRHRTKAQNRGTEPGHGTGAQNRGTEPGHGTGTRNRGTAPGR